MIKGKQSPCDSCRRVDNPLQCENKDCGYWRRWFISRWEQIRRMYQPGEDPCAACVCGEGICTEPCSQKRQWEQKRRGNP